MIRSFGSLPRILTRTFRGGGQGGWGVGAWAGGGWAGGGWAGVAGWAGVTGWAGGGWAGDGGKAVVAVSAVVGSPACAAVRNWVPSRPTASTILFLPIAR